MKNATIIDLPNFRVLFSYKTPVVALDKTEHKVLRTDKKWSVTTSKHIGEFLRDYVSDRNEVIKVDQSVLDKMFSDMSVTRL